jgi:hypothetical protein
MRRACSYEYSNCNQQVSAHSDLYRKHRGHHGWLLLRLTDFVSEGVRRRDRGVRMRTGARLLYYGYSTISGARRKANFRPNSSTTLIWQTYRPGAMFFSGTCTCTGTASGRVLTN